MDFAAGFSFQQRQPCLVVEQRAMGGKTQRSSDLANTGRGDPSKFPPLTYTHTHTHTNTTAQRY